MPADLRVVLQHMISEDWTGLMLPQQPAFMTNKSHGESVSFFSCFVEHYQMSPQIFSSGMLVAQGAACGFFEKRYPDREIRLLDAGR